MKRTGMGKNVEMEISLILSIHAVSGGESSNYENGCEDERILCIHKGNRLLLSGVLDGCGGAGSRKYVASENWTGARIASHEAGCALAEWFQTKNDSEIHSMTIEEVAAELQGKLSKHLKIVKERAEIGNGETRIISNMIKDFPTTLAVMTAESAEKGTVRIRSYWAGNSRNYILLPGGLKQISKDDLENNGDDDDPMADGGLSNCVSASIPFEICCKEIYETGPMILISGTDGIFGYFDSPIRLEWILLDTLQHADTPICWEEGLKAEIDRVSLDDHTLELVALNMGDFQNLKALYKERWSYLQATYMGKLNTAAEKEDGAQLYLELWRQYKEDYLIF